MRAMIAIGMVESAMTGSTKWRAASFSTTQSPVISELNRKWLATNSRSLALAVPATTCHCQTSKNGTEVRPAVSRPDGGSQKGVPLKTNAKGLTKKG